MRYRSKWPEYARQIDSMAILPAALGQFERMAHYAIANKGRYIEVENASGFPWPAVAVAHKRESDAQDAQGNPLFTSYLGNGQPLNRVTTIEPVGRGPFSSFLEGAIDALRLDKITEVVPPWPVEKILFWEETLNGPGYDMLGMPSPYLWGGTSIQRRGKYTSDHHFDPTVMDTQLGVAGMLWMIGHLDTSVHFTRET